MLGNMSMLQFQEWMAFFKIREEERTPGDKKTPPQQGKQAFCLNIMQQMQGYQARREREKKRA